MVPPGERDVVRYEVDNGVAWLTIDRAEAHNALNEAVRIGLFDGVHRFNDDESARVLVLTGAGDRAFCAGADLKEMAATSLKVPPPDFLPQLGRNIAVDKTTIAAVNGLAYASGPLSLRAAKATVYASAELSRIAAFDEAERLWEPVYLSDDAQEGPRAFRERRAPRWTGR